MCALFEIRWHGRGGQGAKTAATFLAAAAITEGKYSQGFPEYGPERRGAPVKGFTRISDKPIVQHDPIDSPDAVVVLDPTLLTIINVTDGLKDNGVFIINTPKPPSWIREKLKIPKNKFKIFTVDATKIALDELGKPIPNTPMIGALARITAVLTMETLKRDITEKFAKKFPDKVITGNLKAIERAFNEVKEE